MGGVPSQQEDLMIYVLAHVVASMVAGTEAETMSVLEERFREAEIVNSVGIWSPGLQEGHRSVRRTPDSEQTRGRS